MGNSGSHSAFNISEEIEYLMMHTSFGEEEILLLQQEVFKKERLTKKEFTSYFCKLFPK